MAKQNITLSYRKKHPRCRYCMYYKTINLMSIHIPSYSKCILKDKIIKETSVNIIDNIRGWHCRYFQPKRLETKWD